MKTKYLIAALLALCAVLFFLFSKKEKVTKNNSVRNITEELTAKKSIVIPHGFFLRNCDSGFLAQTENDPYFVSIDLDTVKYKGIGPSYFFGISNDTSFYVKYGGTKFYKAFHGDTSAYTLGSNEGYLAYMNNCVYYVYESNQVTKDLERPTLLCRKNLMSDATDTLLNMNDYLRKNYPQIRPEEYIIIAGGRFYSLDNNKIAYMPYGINRIFIFDGTDTSSFAPLNSRAVIRWKTVRSKVPGMGDEVITFTTADGDSEHLNDAILYCKGKYLIVNSAVFNAKGADWCYLDVYDAKTLIYEKSLSIKVADRADDFFLSFAVSNGYLAVLSAKGTLSTYKLPL